MSGTSVRWVIVPSGPIRKFLGKTRIRASTTTAEILPLQAKLGPLLRRAWPEASDKDVSWLTADLAALWEVSRKHIILIQKLLKMTGKMERRKLQKLSQELDVNWFSNAPGHMQTLKQELAQFKKSLYAGRSRRPKRKNRSRRKP